MISNSLLASANSDRFAAVHAMKLRNSDIGARSAIQQAKLQNPNATVTANVRYSVGPDGQLYVSGGTVSTTSRSKETANQITPLRNAIENPDAPRAGFQDTRPATLADVLSNKLQLSPLEFALSFSEEFVDDIARAENIIIDGAVRSQETLHYRAAGGLAAGLPQYGTQVGPDGDLIATSGKVDVRASGRSDPRAAARDAATISIAATAPGDASAQDFFVAKSALSQAASLYRQAGIQDRELDIFS